MRIEKQMKVQFIRGYLAALVNPDMMGSAIRVAIVVGTVLFAINHGTALAQGTMTPFRWLAALMTYGVPYAVNIHGPYVMQKQQAAE
ncbi:MAG: nitrate/nitrite transporter NrtS [Cyanobacteria bacterium P01_H01_bin.152]